MDLLAQDLQVTLEGNHILNGVILEAGAGELVGIIGPKAPSSNASTVNWSLRGARCISMAGIYPGRAAGRAPRKLES